MARDRPSQAVALLAEAVRDPVGVPFDCMLCPDLLMGEALDRSGRPDEAVPHYKRAVESKLVLGDDRQMDVVFLVATRERLAVLYEADDEPDEAALQYREILRVWADADPVLQPRVEAARAALERLGR